MHRVVSRDGQQCVPETVLQAIRMCRTAFHWKGGIQSGPPRHTVRRVLRSCVLCSDPAERIVSDRNVAGSEVLDIMTIHFYSLMLGFGLAILTVIGCLSAARRDRRRR